MTKCFVFIDDVGILGQGSFEEHIETVCEILQHISNARLTISVQKIVVRCKEVVFLGSLVDSHGIRSDPRKIESLKKWEAPQDVKGLRRFLRFARYYRRHLEEFARKTVYLTNLLKKSNEYEQTPEQDKAFQMIKKGLIQLSVLAKLVWEDSRPFHLYCDPESSSVGYILKEEDVDGQKVPLAYDG